MTFIELLKTIKDPRKQRGQRYSLRLVIFLSQLGSLCGYSGYRPLAKVCQKHQQHLRQLLGLAADTRLLPSYSTFRRLFEQVEAQA